MSELSDALKALEEVLKGESPDARQNAITLLEYHRAKPKLEESALDKNYLKDLAEIISKRLPDNYGFILLTGGAGTGGRTNYIANVPRENAIDWMAETAV